MVVMRPSVTALARYRRHRTLGIALFVMLVLLVGVERRLADAQFNRFSVAPAFESNDLLDGDEVRVRLVALNDDKPPAVPDVSGAVTREPVHTVVRHRPLLALGRPAPRGPPALSAA
jgi:hypothetical protein